MALTIENIIAKAGCASKQDIFLGQGAINGMKAIAKIRRHIGDNEIANSIENEIREIEIGIRFAIQKEFAQYN